VEERTIDLESIRAEEAAATPGPWEWDTGAEPWQRYRLMSMSPPAEVVAVGWDGEGNESMTISAADMAFIAHARSAIPLLLAEIDRLSALLSPP
jgi:hypothetical protein